MLMSMQQLASTSVAPRLSRDFAGILAEFASPPKKPPQPDLDGLEDDVAILSYEPALRGQSRSVPTPPTIAEPLATTSEPRSRKSSSVTVRLTTSEAEQLRARAAEAGLTVSAYLRSCAFEVESLRAEVKSTLAQLRSVTTAPVVRQEQPHRAWLRPWQRLFRKHSLSVP